MSFKLKVHENKLMSFKLKVHENKLMSLLKQ